MGRMRAWTASTFSSFTSGAGAAGGACDSCAEAAAATSAVTPTAARQDRWKSEAPLRFAPPTLLWTMTDLLPRARARSCRY